MDGFYDKLKTAYWNHLKLSDLIIAIVLVFLIRLILESNFSPVELNDIISASKNDIYTIVATVAGTLLGFILTSISIIVTFTEFDKLKLLKDTGYYDKLFGIYFATIKSLAITAIISVIGILLSSGAVIWFYMILISTIVSGLLMWASIWALEMVISIVKK